MTDRLHDLVPVTQLLMERALDNHRKNIAESQRVAAEIDEIDALRQRAQGQMQDMGPQRMIGADTLWQGWLMQRRARLMQESALCRARELDSFGRARLAFARAEATRSLDEKRLAELRARRLFHEEERLEALSVLRDSWR